MLAIRRRTRRQNKEPLQLDLFVPKDFDHEYKVIHNGRGSQEGILGEAKSCTQLDYIPMRRLAGNRRFTLASVMAHNRGRELQIVAAERSPSDTIKRAPRWPFAKLSTLRRRIFLRAGRTSLCNIRVDAVMLEPRAMGVRRGSTENRMRSGPPQSHRPRAKMP